MSIQFPSIPTDNFYKFLAVGGLILFVLTLYSNYYLMIKVETSLADIEAEAEILKIERSSIKEKIDYFKKKGRLNNEELSIQEKQLKISAARLDGNLRKTEITFNYLQELAYYNFALIFVGVFMMSIGFRLWYRLQKVQDRILESEIKRINELP